MLHGRHSNLVLPLMLLASVCFAGCGDDRTGLNPVTLIAEEGDETGPVFSPDGESIAYAWTTGEGECHIYVINIESHQKRRVTSAKAVNSNPAWSSDGKWIAFQSNRDGLDNIYTIPAGAPPAGGDLPRGVPLTRRCGNNRKPSWSPDGTRIVFETDRNGRSDICVMKSNGSDQLVLTKSASHDRDPAWSPDGKLIAFSSERTGQADIWIVNPDGSHPRRLTTDKAAEWDPAWTPDSFQLIHLYQVEGGIFQFWEVYCEGQKPAQVLASNATIAGPAIDPNGQWLAFSADRDGSFNLYLLRMAGSPKGESDDQDRSR